MFSALMKKVVIDNTQRALFANLHILPVETPNTSSASSEIVPQELPKFAATPAAGKKRKAEEVDAGIATASKKVKTKEPSQPPQLERLLVKELSEQSNADVVDHTVQASSIDPQPAPKIIKNGRGRKSQKKKKKITPGFDRFREDGLFCSNVPAEKTAEQIKPPVPLFSKEPADALHGAVDRKDIPDARCPSGASSSGKVTVAGLVTSPESAFPDDKPSTVPHRANTSNVGEQSIFKRITASARRKKAAAATSSEIRSWMSIRPNRVPGPKDVGSCDKMRLPGTDTKLLPCHLLHLLDWRTYEPRSAADRDLVEAALATRKKERKKTSPKCDRITKKQGQDKEQRREKKKVKSNSSAQHSPPCQCQGPSSDIPANAPILEMPHAPAIYDTPCTMDVL